MFESKTMMFGAAQLGPELFIWPGLKALFLNNIALKDQFILKQSVMFLLRFWAIKMRSWGDLKSVQVNLCLVFEMQLWSTSRLCIYECGLLHFAGKAYMCGCNTEE